MRAAAVLLVLPLLASLAPSGSASIDACAPPATRSFDGTIVPMLEVSGKLAFVTGSCGGSSRHVSGCGSLGCMAPCGDLGVYVVGTTYCGPLVAPGGMATCSWASGPGTFTAVTMGFDVDGDGNITTADPAFTEGRVPRPDAVGTVEGIIGVSNWPAPVAGSWIVDNPSDVTGRVIVYPTSVANVQSNGTGLIGCA